MSAKITVAYEKDAELQEILKRLSPLVKKSKGPYKTQDGKYYRVHASLKLPENAAE